MRRTICSHDDGDGTTQCSVQLGMDSETVPGFGLWHVLAFQLLDRDGEVTLHEFINGIMHCKVTPRLARRR